MQQPISQTSNIKFLFVVTWKGYFETRKMEFNNILDAFEYKDMLKEKGIKAKFKRERVY